MTSITRVEVETLVRWEKERISLAAYLSLKPSYPATVAVKPYHLGYMVQILKNFMDAKAISEST